MSQRGAGANEKGLDMKLGDVLRKERERRALTAEDVASRLGLSLEEYGQIEAGNSPAEEWGPKRLARIAIKLETPTSRLLAESGKFADTRAVAGQCGMLVKKHRERRGLSPEALAEYVQVPVEEMISIENGESPIETYGPVLLGFAEIVELPVFNLFYPAGLPLDELDDYP